MKAEAKRLGIEFDPWQDGAGSIVFGRRSDGSFASSIGGNVMSIPRQVGKTFFLGAIAFALCMLRPGLLVIWTAHQLPTAGETFRSMQAMAKRSKVAPHVKQLRVGSGDWSVEFHNGSRILFGARERGFGLGFTKVGLLILDEGQRVTEKTLDDLVPTMNQAVDPLMFMVGTPPRPTDMGEEFKRRRREALSGESDDMVYIECSAEPSVRVSSWRKGQVDWSAVETANPSFPSRTPRSAVLRMRKNLGDESFQREGLGIWDSDDAGTRIIPADLWTTRGVDVAPEGVKSFGVAFSMNGDRVSLGGARKHADGVHTELIDAKADLDITNGLGGLADWLAERWRDTALIVLSGSAGAGVLAKLLTDRGVPRGMIQVANTSQYLQACSMTVDALKDGTATHLTSDGQAVLDASVAVTDTDKRGGFVATTPDGDEVPFEAVALALWGASTTKRKPRGTEKRKAVIL